MDSTLWPDLRTNGTAPAKLIRPMFKTAQVKLTLIIALIATLMATLILLIAYGLVNSDERATVAYATDRVSKYAVGAELAVNRNLLSIDMQLSGIADVLSTAHVHESDLGAQGTTALLRNLADQNMMIRDFIFLDTKLRVVASSNQGYFTTEQALNGEFLALLLNDNAQQIVISRPQKMLTTAEQGIFFARKLSLEGQAIYVVATVPVSQLVAAFSQGVESDGFEITLENEQGLLLASAPLNTALLGQYLYPNINASWKLGTTDWRLARLSENYSLLTARRSIYPGLYITTALSKGQIYKEWYRDTRTVIFTTAAIVLSLLALAWFARHYLIGLLTTRQQLSESKLTVEKALESMNGGFILVNQDDKIVRWNQKLFEYFPWLKSVLVEGIAFRDAIKVSAAYLIPNASPEELATWIEQRMHRHLATTGNEVMVLPTKRTIQVVENRTSDGGIVCLYWDITERKQNEEAIERLAYYDPLTGLPNRRLLLEVLTTTIEKSHAGAMYTGLLFIDLDDFKTLNDTFGHHMGDLLLQQVAERLRSATREGDTVARLGGDEFVVRLGALAEEQPDAHKVATELSVRILHSMNNPFDLETNQFRSTPSIGVVLFNSADHSADELMRMADIAMYAAKTAGRNTVRFFSPDMQENVEVRSAIEKDLITAIPNQQFELYYQLQVDHRNEVVGVEALIRWNHPNRGLIRPSEFIGVAEQSGQIISIGYWVLKTACEQLNQWHLDPRFQHIRISVNVSARQFKQADFIVRFRELFTAYTFTPSNLELELTESLVMDNLVDAQAKMNELRALGLRFSMDDFGTGHSSLAMLRKLPFDQIKIDQSFVADVLDDYDD
ncbi:MAG: hypothetical protein RLZZ502_1527, partial [Pseudomonadota bacterium]